MRIRLAKLTDIPMLTDLIAKSARSLCRKDYSADQVEAALKGAWAVDTQLIEDQTYFVCEKGGKIVGCGGWSMRTTLFGGDTFDQRDASKLDPGSDPAKIRAFFVDPDFIGHNIGAAILDRCETEAARAGFRAYELMATLTGARFYARHGYVGNGQTSVRLSGGVDVDFIPMSKQRHISMSDRTAPPSPRP